MPTIADIAAFLEQVAPLRLAEEWDNVGLLVGHRTQKVARVLTCLTVTPASAAEAIEQQADLIVTHHPLPFHAVRQVTSDTTVGRLLLELISARVAVYSLHTAFDSTIGGINDRLAAGLSLQGVAPLAPAAGNREAPDGTEASAPSAGAGRWGWLTNPTTLGQLADRLKELLSVKRLQVVGRPEHRVRTVAIGCGAADSLLAAAAANRCDAMVLGEARFHTCLEAEALGIGLLLPGHFASERFAVEHLAEVLGRQFSDLKTWASRSETDPMRWQ